MTLPRGVGSSEDLTEALYATKSRDWEYEEEVRVQIRLADCVLHNDLYFERLAENLSITGFSVKLYRSRLACRLFRVVRHKAFPVETIRGV